MGDNLKIADELASQGWAVRENYFSPSLTHSLLHDLETMRSLGQLKRASIGRATNLQHNDSVRTDQTLWITGENEAQAQYFAHMNQLRTDINQSLFMGLFDFEAHYAQYATGGFYKKHVDALHGAKNRVISTVTYLTPDWTEKDQGHLVLYAPDNEDREIARILPRAGTLAVFLSETIPHEVLPPVRPRSSIAGWFRVRSV